MAPVSRRTALGALGGTGLSALAGVAAAKSGIANAFDGHAPAELTAASGHAKDPVFTWVSMPDFFNGDVADLSVLPSWDGGPNSVNDSWTTAIDKCLGGVVDRKPDAVFLTGDMVEGRWNVDTGERQLFGAVSSGIDPESIAMGQAAVTVAGGAYYSYGSKLFTSRGLTMFPAVGDHEILDDRPGPLNNRWSPTGFNHNGTPDNRYYLVDHCKDVWANHFTRHHGKPLHARRPIGTKAEFSAYSVSFADALTLITVDTFDRNQHGVRLGVFDGQLRWLRSEIRHAKARGHAVIVQGHIPIIWPSRWLASGRLRVPNGRDSEFYKVLDREGVDFYLCGEVHDSTMHQHTRTGPVQISHGCIFRYGFSYLVGRLFPDKRFVIDLYEVPVLRASRQHDLWCSDTPKSQRTYLDYGDPVHRGRLVAKDNVVLKHTEKLGHYRPGDDPFGLRGNLKTVVY
jgi:3',5'-cyclic AMP phosphodiesterase CpdA